MTTGHPPQLGSWAAHLGGAYRRRSTGLQFGVVVVPGTGCSANGGAACSWSSYRRRSCLSATLFGLALLRYCATALLRYCATALLCTALLRYCATALSYFIVIVASAVSSFSAQWSSSLPRQCLCFLVVNARRRRSTRAFVLRRSHCILRNYSVLIMIFISRYSVLLLLFSLPCSARCGY